MTEMMQGILSEAKNGRFSSIKDVLSEEDISSVWENAAAFIERQMSQQKGVNIPNLGTFTFSQKRLEVGNNKYVLIQRPVFNISERFAQTHSLHFTKYHVPGHIPVVQLNYAALSFESPFDRDTVESCVREILNAIGRAVANKKNVELSFVGIGRLSIRESRVKMKFFKDFIHQMDGSGKLVDSLQNRPGTLDSVMSDRSIMSRAATGNTLILPKISSSHAVGNNLPALTEQEETNSVHEEENLVTDYTADYTADVVPTDEIDVQAVAAPVERPDIQDIVVEETGDFQTDNAVSNILNTADVGHVEGVNEFAGDVPVNVPRTDQAFEEEYQELAPSVRSCSRQAMPLAKASGVSLMDDLAPATLVPQAVPGSSHVGVMPSHSPMVPCTPLVNKSYPLPQTFSEGVTQSPFPPRTPLNKVLAPPHLIPLTRARSAEQTHTEPRDVTFCESVKPSSACGHPNAGQELCYLCHQRYTRNIPVSFNAEKKRREEEEDILLKQFQAMKDGEEHMREQEKNFAKRNDLQKIAAFNLGVAEAVTANKKTRDTEFHRSYIFQKRALTPHRFPKQEAYNKDLEKQVEAKEKAKQEQTANNDMLERLEQVQLAEDLAAQREQYLRNKLEQQDTYKKALETQIIIRNKYRKPDGLIKSPDLVMSSKYKNYVPEPPISFLTVPKPYPLHPFSERRFIPNSSNTRLKYKPVPLVPREPDSEVFGLHDRTNEKMAERRRKAYNLFREQQDVVAQKKRDAILRRLAEQEEEEEVLDRTKQELIEDRSNRFRRRYAMRKELESDWFESAQGKRARELQEKLSDLHPGALVHEQCDKYKRCQKCCRKLTNCGETNLWKESRYIPGSRLIV